MRFQKTFAVGASLALILVLVSSPFAAEKQVTLEYWEGPPREGMYEALDIAIKAFEKKRPNVKIQITQVPWGKFAEKFQMGKITGYLPDLSDAYASLPQSLYGQGITMPLNDVFEEIGPEKFSPWTQKLMTIGGNVIGLPFVNPPHVLWYRKDLFRDNGIAVPRKWNEWLNAVRKLTMDTDGDGRTDFYGILQYLLDIEPQALLNLMYTSGGSNFDEKGEVAINSPATKASIDFLKELWPYSQPGAAGQNMTHARTLMMSGKGAMNVSSMSLTAVMAGLAAEKREIYGNAPIPKWEKYDGPWTGTAAYFFLVVPKTTEHPEIVKDYLKTFFSDEVYWKYCAQTYRGWLPVMLPTQTDPRYLGHPRVKPYLDFFKVGLGVTPGSLAFGQEYGGNIFGGLIDSKGVWIEMIERAVLKNEPTEDIVKWAEKKIKEIVKEYR